MNFGIIKTIVRGLQLFFVLIATAMIGDVISKTRHANTNNRAAVGFCMAALFFAWAAVLYGWAGRLKSSLEFPHVMFLLDSFAAFMMFIAAVVLAALLRVVNCGALDHKKFKGDYIVWGSNNDVQRCRELQTATAFSWFLLFSLFASMFLSWRDWKGFGGYSGSLRSAPMSQVRGV